MKRTEAQKRTLAKHAIRDTERARELGRKGGLASGAAKAERRTMREWAEALRDAPPPKGVKGETNAAAVIISAYNAAQHGDIQAAKFLAEIMRETEAGTVAAVVSPIILGEIPADKVRKAKEDCEARRARTG